ncbi:hypothetical protein ACQY0O_005655 [Thecaphora frezii]
MYYISHLHKPSATLQSLVLPDFLPSGPCLALVYHSSIAFLALPANHAAPPAHHVPLQQITSVDINARILTVQALAADDGAAARSTKRLVVLTDHHRPRLVVLRHAGGALADHAILTEATLLLEEAARTPAELGLGLFVEPLTATVGVTGGSASGVRGQRYAAAHTHSGLLRILPIGQRALQASSSSQALTARKKEKRRASVRTASPDVEMEEAVAALDIEIGKPNTSQAFSVRLPHPTLISSAFLHPHEAQEASAVALLSLSSIPSRIPGLGQQCLPVLSFHAIDPKLHELRPLPWGAPRRAPSTPAASSTKRDAKSGTDGGGRMPGAFGGGDDNDDDDDVGPRRAAGASSGKRGQTQTRKGRGPSALGDRLDDAALQKREEKWAKAPLTQAHVPLPYTDALGAHLIHALPASVGGGVVVFSETSILLVPPPSASYVDPLALATAATTAAGTGSESAAAAGKRRKGSSSGKAEPTTEVLGTSPTGPSSRSNENGKRRRSSVATAAPSLPDSPGAAAARSSERRSVHLLRTTLPLPVQVAAAATVAEADGSDVVVDPEAPGSRGHLDVLFACNSGSLDLLRIRLARSPSQAVPGEQGAWRPVGLLVEHLGSTSQATGPNALTYLGEGFVHVSSTTGDAVLSRIVARDEEHDARRRAADDTDGDVQLITPPSSPSQALAQPPPTSSSSASELGGLPSAGRLVEVHRWDNLGPIVDFAVDDGSGGDPADASSAQARIITCSGSGPTSSLRVIKTGVATDEVAELDLGSATRIWTLHSSRGAAKASIALALGHAAGTSFVAFGPDGSIVDVTDAVAAAAGVATTSPALAIASIEARDGQGQGQADGGGASALVVVIDRSQAALLALRAGGEVEKVATWQPAGEAVGAGIANAAANDRGQVLVSLRDRSLVYLESDRAGFREVTRTALDDEAACLDISPLHALRSAEHCAVGFWGSRTAQIFTLPELKPVGQSSFAQERLASLPRSILLHRFDTATGDGAAGVPYLLLGLGDGTLISHRLSLPDAESYSDTVGVFDQKVVSLGSRALRLEPIQTSQGLLAVSVAGERPTIVFADAKRLSYSAVKYRQVRSAGALFAAGQPVLTAFALPDGVRIASVGALQKLDIRTVALGREQPLAIAPHPEARAFGVVTWSFLPQGTATIGLDVRGAVRLLDQAELAPLDEVKLEAYERPNCVETVRLNDQRTYLVVGTGYIRPDASETVNGRLIGYEVVEPDADAGANIGRAKGRRRLKLAFEEEVGGNVYAVVGIQGRIAAAINSRVAVFEVSNAAAAANAGPSVRRGGRLATLTQTGEWGSAFVACTLARAVEPDRLVVGDALRSMNVLEVEGEGGGVSEVARDCEPFWTTAAAMVDEASQTFVGADVGFNLYTTQRVKLGEAELRRMQRARDAELESGQQRARGRYHGRGLVDGYAHVMQRQAVWHYGDMINRFKRGSLTSGSRLTSGSGSGAAIAEARIIFGTASGGIGILAQLEPHVASCISGLERKIVELVQESPSFGRGGVGSAEESHYLGVVGDIPHGEYRTMRTDHRVQQSAGVVDGEVVRLWCCNRVGRRVREALRAREGGAEGREMGDWNDVDRWAQALVQMV